MIILPVLLPPSSLEKSGHEPLSKPHPGKPLGAFGRQATADGLASGRSRC